MRSTADASPLRRNGFTFLLVHVNAFIIFLAIFCLAAGFVQSQPAVVALGLVSSVVACSPFLLGAKVTGTHLDFGYRWGRKHVALDEITGLRIGKALRFGLRGGDAKGMRLMLRNGDVLMVDESQFCTRRRLVDWSDELVSRAPTIQVDFGEIAYIDGR